MMSEFPWDFLYLFIPLIFLCTFILCLFCFIAFFPLLKDPKDTFWTFLFILLKSYRWIIDTSNFIVTMLTFFFFFVTFSSLVEIKLCDSAFCALLDVYFPLSVASIGENFILFWVSRVLIAVNISELIEYHPHLCKWQAMIFHLIKKWFLLFIHKNQGKHELKTVSQHSVNSTYHRSGWCSRLEVAPTWGCLLYLPVLCLSYAKLSLFGFFLYSFHSWHCKC